MTQDKHLDQDTVVTCEHVTWVDSQSSSDWQPAPDEVGAAIVESVGFVILETEDTLVLTHSLDRENGNICLDMAIPKCSIKKRNVIGTVKGDNQFYPSNIFDELAKKRKNKR